MVVQSIKIEGFRGFRSSQAVKFAVPTGKIGSGLTVITGENNSGKSSILECFKLRAGSNAPSFTVGMRNRTLDSVRVSFQIDGSEEVVRSRELGSSESVRENFNMEKRVFVLPSRRAFAPYFSKSTVNRESYINSYAISAQRDSTLSGFEYRMFKILENPENFNNLVERLLGYSPKWTIDLADQGAYFLKFYNADDHHTSDGMGEGVISVFAIADALYDSKPGDTIVVDEPELSVHPAVQRRLSDLLSEYACSRQIIISTHSPYFVVLENIKNGSELVRVVSRGNGTEIFQLGNHSIKSIDKLTSGNLFNPHIMGLDAREIFFLDDGIILTEGQEDVLLYPELARQIGVVIPGTFFGWGAGGAGNIGHLCSVFQSLGYQRVFGVLDGDKRDEMLALRRAYPSYAFDCIPTDDIRDKAARPGSEAVSGLLDAARVLKPQFKQDVQALLATMATAMAGKDAKTA